jgi:clorobiocin biosynthesis protein CloN6
MGQHVNAIVELSPDSHDIVISKAAGRGYYTMEEMEEFIDATVDDIYSFEVYFMIGLPKQSVQSVWDTVDYCEHLLKKYQGKNIVPYVAPMLPFLDPGSEIYDHPEKFGYKISRHTLEDHRQALLEMNWKNRLNYETQWMTRDELVDVSYKSVAKLTQLKNKYGQMPTGMTNSIVTLLDQTYAMMKEIDAYQAMPPGPEADAIGADLRRRIFEYNQKQFKMVRSQQRPVDFGFAKQQWFDTDEAFERIMTHGVPPPPSRSSGSGDAPEVGAPAA